jgi:3-oxoacyl-[acyl-carrier-protein] synthase III
MTKEATILRGVRYMPKALVKILGSGVHLPSIELSSQALEKKLGYHPGTWERASSVRRRYHVAEETASDLGAAAAKMALEEARIASSQIDAIISVSGTYQQLVPSTSALIHKKLGLAGSVAFDINATCLSFLTGLFCIGHLISQGIYRHVLLVSSDIASPGLNPNDPKTALLFGDGAAAVVLGPGTSEGIIASHFETRTERELDCQCEAGGTLSSFKDHISKERLYFQMNGPRLFKAALPPLLDMIHKLTEGLDREVDLIIPHQASPFALDLLQKKLGVPDHQFMHIVRDYGNMIATSIPFALHTAIKEERLRRGNRALLLGTAAGLSIGGIVLEY